MLVMNAIEESGRVVGKRISGLLQITCRGWISPSCFGMLVKGDLEQDRDAISEAEKPGCGENTVS